MTRLTALTLLTALMLAPAAWAQDEITLDGDDGEASATQPAATDSAEAAEPATPPDDRFATDEAKVSYGLGMNMGMMAAQTIQQVPLDFDIDLVLAGIEDALRQNDPQISAEAVQGAMTRLEQRLAAQQEQMVNAASQQNIAKGDAYREANAQKEGVKTTASGMQYRVVNTGEGASPSLGDTVTFNYRLRLVSGAVLQDSFVQGRDPLVTPLVPQQMIPGMVEALQMMKVGDRWELVLPPALGYGSDPRGPGGPNSTLLFDIELLDVEKPAADDAGE